MSVSFGSVSGYLTPADQMSRCQMAVRGPARASYVAAAQYGTLSISTNLTAASFTVTGPQTFWGSGTSWTKENVLPGTYTVTFDKNGRTVNLRLRRVLLLPEADCRSMVRIRNWRACRCMWRRKARTG